MSVPRPDSWLLRAEKFLPENSKRQIVVAKKQRKFPTMKATAEALPAYEYDNIGELLSKKVPNRRSSPPTRKLSSPPRTNQGKPKGGSPNTTRSPKKASPEKTRRSNQGKKPSAQEKKPPAQEKPEPKVKPVKEPRVKMPKDVVMPRF